MSHQRRKHFGVDKLSREGRGLVDSLLSRSTSTYDGISRELLKKTSERIAPSSLQRYHQESLLHGEPDYLYVLIRQALGKFAPTELQILAKLLTCLGDAVNQHREP
jgi:hypothetical protein